MRRAPTAIITSIGGYEPGVVEPPPYESSLCPKKHAGTSNTLTIEFHPAGPRPQRVLWRSSCPGPTSRTPAQRSPSMGLKDHS
jgi:hypothetical protein